MTQNSLALLRQGLEHQQAGRLREAEAAYRAVLQGAPGNPDALNLLGALALGRGDHPAAIEWISQAVRVSPQTALYQYNLGVAWQGLGRLAEAAPCFLAAARLDPRFRDAHFNLGAVLQALGRTDEAIAAYEQAVALQPDSGVLNNLGAAYRARGDLARALRCFEQAVQLEPNHADGLYNLALALQAAGQAARAAACFVQRSRLPPVPPELPGLLGRALQQCGRAGEAEACYRQALQLRPEAAVANNLAVLLQQRFAFDEAEHLLREAVSREPDYAEAFGNLGNVLLDRGRPDEAELAFTHALRLKPDYRDAFYNRAHARLTLGRFEEGWADYEHRWQAQGFPSRKPDFPQPEWTGENLRGRTLLVYNEQGLGDTIQFARYFRLAADRGGRVLFASPPELQPLLQGLPELSGLLEPGQPLPPFDAHAALMSLPLLCGTRLDSIPNRVPYLPVPGPERFPLPPPTPGRLRVGLVWGGGTRFPKDGLRSLSLNDLLPLLRGADCDFFSLQAGPRSAECRSLPPGVKLVDVGSRVRDFADTAAVMGQLDLVISTCTSTLHLAGALGRPVWGLLAYAPDWRWMRDREDSPWYATLRLFRQSRPWDWQGVLQRVQRELQELAARCRNGARPAPEWFAPPRAPAVPTAAVPAGEAPVPGQLFMSGQTSGGFGWGTVNRGLFEALAERTPTTLIGPADPRFLSPRLPGALLTTLLGHDFVPECPTRGRLNLANAVFEQELPPEAVENAKLFDVVFTASTWCVERMKEKGIPNAALLLQGVNTRIFRPLADAGPRADGRFILFSGGKFELRKGQDLVLRAFRTLSRKFPDLVLVTAWHNLWPASLQTMAASPHLRFELRGATWPEQLAHLCGLNDIDPQRVVALKPGGAEEMARVYRHAHLGVFPNRCEGATNLVLMEFLACGGPAIVSFNSGHCDVVHEGNALLLKDQRALELKDAAGKVAARWRESSVDEIIAAVEFAYLHRAEMQALGAAAAEDLKRWDWCRAAGVVLDAMSGHFRLSPPGRRA